MNTHDATMIYREPIADGSTKLCLDLFPAVPDAFGEAHDTMVQHFGMRESNEIKGLMSLRASTDATAFLAFFGRTWDEALQRWPTLSFFHSYRQEHGPENYASVEAWQQFYRLAESGVLPTEISMAFIEHH